MKKALTTQHFLTFAIFLFVNVFLTPTVFSQTEVHHSETDQHHAHSEDYSQPISLVGFSREDVEHFILENYDYNEILEELGIIKEYRKKQSMQDFVFPLINSFYKQIYKDVAFGSLTHSDQIIPIYTGTIISIKDQIAGQVFPDDGPFTPKLLNGPCVNMDFETGDLSGWSLETGMVDGSIPYSYVGGTPAGPGPSHLIVNGGNDPVIPAIPMVNPDGGAFSTRLGNGITDGAGAAKMRQTFLVTPTNSILTYSYAVVFEDPGHPVAQQPYFSVRVFDENNNTIQCGTYSVIAGNNATANGFIRSGGILYKNWETVFSPLNAYIGQNVTVEFTTGDCSQTGHYGYAYVDASCNTFDITTSTGDTVLCVGDNMTLFAPAGGASYLWNNGATTSSININQPGTYQVDVIPFQGSLCAISIEIEIVSVPVPVSEFSFTPVCIGLPTSFTGLSTIDPSSSINSTTWDFGGGNTSTLPNPTFTFTTPGNHNVSLTTTTPAGCTNTITKAVNVMPKPVVNFTVPNTCADVISTFTNTSTIAAPSTIAAYAWDIEANGSVDYTTQNITHQFTHGAHSTKLVVTSDFGCKDSLTRNFTVYPVPVANFTSTQICLGETTAFQNTSTLVGTGTITGWNWTFGDGATSALETPTHTYATSGTFNVTLEVTTNNGCTHSVTLPVIVNPLPVANFTFVNACFNSTLQFTQTASANTTTYLWNFGDGATSTLPNPTHQYAAPGDYQVKLVVSAGAVTCLDSITQTVTAYALPVPSFTVANECVTDQLIFNNTSTVPLPSTLGTYAWSFGDGNASTLASPSNLYAAEGNYTVKLIVTSNHGCVDSTSQQVTVWPLPIVDFSSTTVCETFVTGYTDLSTVSSTNSANTNTGWNWTLGDGNTANTQNPTHTYLAAGDYQVTLQVTTANNCVNSATKTVTVMPLPVVDFTVTEVCATSITDFTNTSTVAAPSSLATYAWDILSDNSVEYTTVNAQHQFTHGNYSTTLTVTTDFGCTISETKTFDVYPVPVSDFLANPLCLGNPTNFQDSTKLIGVGTITGWNWNLGDGTTSTLQNPVHTYAAPGIYVVTLTTTTDHNCTNQITKNIEIYELPVSGYTFSNECFNEDIQFNQTASVNSSQFNWDFGDGSFSTLLDPTHQYVAPGDYQVKLVVTTAIGGCKDSVTQTITAYPLPVPVYTLANQCVNAQVVYNNQSTILAPDNIATYAWSFGDGNTSATQSPSHLYSNDGVYTTKLILTSNHGCIDSISHQVTVWPLPVVDFSPTEVCLNFDTQFSDLTNISSANSNNSITSWNWNFDDGTTSSNQHPTHAYGTSGLYQVTLQVTSNNGCQASATKGVYVFPNPTVSFTGNNLTGCSPVCFNVNSTSFIDNSHTIQNPSSITNYQWNFSNGTSIDSGLNPSYAACFSNDTDAPQLIDVQLIVTTNIGCVDSVTATNYILVKDLPHADFDFSPTAPTSVYSQVTTTNHSTNADTYNWSIPGVGNSTIFEPTFNLEETAPGMYAITLVVQTNEGCRDSVIKGFELLDELIIYVPNTFTPDGDNYNNEFLPVLTSGFDKYTYTLLIYDRWGEVMFESHDHLVGWDGTYLDRIVPDGTFIWKINVKEARTDKRRTFEGHVTILR